MVERRRTRERRLEEIGCEMATELVTIRTELEDVIGRRFLTPATRSDLRDLLGRVDDAYLVLSRELDRSSPDRRWLRSALALGGSAAMFVGGWVADVGAGEVSQHFELRSPITRAGDAAARTIDLGAEVAGPARTDAVEPSVGVSARVLRAGGGDPVDRPPAFEPGEHVAWGMTRTSRTAEVAVITLWFNPGTDRASRLRVELTDPSGLMAIRSDDDLAEKAMAAVLDRLNDAVMTRVSGPPWE